MYQFQSTFPQGERHPRPNSIDKPLAVSIHVPARGTTRYNPHNSGIDPVSIHVPARGTTLFFPKTNSLIYVSIHVPARGTTWKEKMINEDYIWFQSTFPQGERLEFGLNDVICHCFNPRSRKGNDATAVDFFTPPSVVSIHVPARGTTSRSRLFCSAVLFQSTFPQGERRLHST